MLKHSLSVVALVLLTAAFNNSIAAEEVAKSTAKTEKTQWEEFKESNDLLLVNEIGTNTSADSSVYTDTVGYFTHRLDSNNSLRAYIEYWNENTNVNDGNEEFNGQYEASEIRYRRSNILSEKEHGVGMSADLRFAHYGNAIQEHNLLGWRYAIDPRINFSKSLGAVSTALTLRYSEYLMEETNETDGQFKRTYQVYFSQAYNITDKISVSNLFLYRRYFNTESGVASNTASEYLRMYPTIGYTFDMGLTVETYYRLVPFTRGNDNHMRYQKDMFKNGIAAVALSYGVF